MTTPDRERDPGADAEIVVFKCEECGDTFPWSPQTPRHRGDHPSCPSCKSSKVHEAREPLL